MKKKSRSKTSKKVSSSAKSLVSQSGIVAASCPTIPVSQVAEIAIELWKISARASKVPGNEKVLTACERAEDRLTRIGFEIQDLTEEPYDINMKVRVIEHEPGPGGFRVLECLTPAVYFDQILISEAEIVTTGEKS